MRILQNHSHVTGGTYIAKYVKVGTLLVLIVYSLEDESTPRDDRQEARSKRSGTKETMARCIDQRAEERERKQPEQFRFAAAVRTGAAKRGDAAVHRNFSICSAVRLSIA